MKSSTELRQERAEVVAEMRKTSDSAAPEDVAKWKTLDTRQEALRVQIENSERTAALETEMRAVHNPAPPPIPSGDDVHGDNERSTSPNTEIRASKQYARDFFQ